MKKILFLLSLILCFSCTDKELYSYQSDYEYKQSFTQEFGQIPEDQSWDFFSSILNGTRATSEVTIKDATQPRNLPTTKWGNYLPNGVDNRAKGDNTGTLIGNGEFNIYAMWYGGSIQVGNQYKFES